MQGQRIAGTADENLDEELRNFSLRKAICSMIPTSRHKSTAVASAS